MSCVPSLQAGKGAETQEPSVSHLVSQLEASREMGNLFQGARPAWAHLQAVKALASGVLCDSLGHAKFLSYKPDRFLPALRPLDHGPCLGTDTTFENHIDCSVFEVVIIGLVEGH